MKRLLFISHRVPYPPDKGERVRAFHEIVALAEHFRVTVAALAHVPSDFETVAPLRSFCEKLIVRPAGGRLGLLRGALALVRGGSVTEGFFRSPSLRRALRDESAREPFDVVVAYSSGVLRAALEVPAAGHVIDLVDVDSAKWESYAEASHWSKRRLYRREARGVRALETEALARCDAVFLVSEAEVAALDRRDGHVVAMGNGVDLDYFHRAEPARDENPKLAFTGTMDYRPNIEGVCDFVHDVWPGLLKQRPALQLSIVGRNPAPAVRQLEEVPGVRVTGSVPDVRPYLADASAAVVPLKIARGIQNKVLEAMSMGRAVVASGPALEGLDVTVGDDILRADTPEEWRQQIGMVLDNADFRSQLEHRARKTIEAHYNWDARMEPLVHTCRMLANEGGKP